MSIKSCDRIFRKEKGSKICRKPISEAVTDEIALKDEILELKRQVMFLKRTNEQNMVKFRKYEDEAKRKDRQIEQLMDPRKNSDITKNLSTKGAAILMNLKDQNNSLIQIILNKDLQIRRLIAEIKMSKLYASSRKSEPYKAEIVRLRNLLLKSQESLKENINLQQKQQETTSICVNGNPLLEVSSSSDQSSPRELEELRFTIQSLETHIKYSNDLLAKKNQEILVLSDELNALRRLVQHRTARNTTGSQAFDCTLPDYYSWKGFPTTEPTYYWENKLKTDEITEEPPKTPIEESEELFEKTTKILDNDKPPHSAPVISVNWFPPNESTPKRSSSSNIETENYNQEIEKEKFFEEESEAICNVNKENDEKINPTTSKEIPSLRKSLLHDLAADEVFKEEKMLLERVEKKYKTKEKWKSVWVKYKQSNCIKEEKESSETNHDKEKNKPHKENLKSPDEDLETHEFESMEKDVLYYDNEKQKTLEFQEKHHEAAEQILENNETAGDSKIQLELSSSLPEKQDGGSNGQASADDKILDGSNTRRQSLQSLNTNEDIISLDKSFIESHEMIENIKKEIRTKASSFSPEIQRELRILYENVSSYEEKEIKKVKSLREVYKQSLDSSFDSEYSYPVKCVQVEVQINTIPTQSDSYRSDTVSENTDVLECRKSDAEDLALNDTFTDDDDDDVIIRKKI